MDSSSAAFSQRDTPLERPIRPADHLEQTLPWVEGLNDTTVVEYTSRYSLRPLKTIIPIHMEQQPCLRWTFLEAFRPGVLRLSLYLGRSN